MRLQTLAVYSDARSTELIVLKQEKTPGLQRLTRVPSLPLNIL